MPACSRRLRCGAMPQHVGMCLAPAPTFQLASCRAARRLGSAPARRRCGCQPLSPDNPGQVGQCRRGQRLGGSPKLPEKSSATAQVGDAGLVVGRPAAFTALKLTALKTLPQASTS